MLKYNLCLRIKNNRGFFHVKSFMNLKNIDDETAYFLNQDELLWHYIYVDKMVMPPENQVEQVLITYEDEDYTVDLGGVLYADSKDISDKNKNIAFLRNKSDDPEFILKLMSKYIELRKVSSALFNQYVDENVEDIEIANQIINLSKDSTTNEENSISQTFAKLKYILFVNSLDLDSNYLAYRTLFLANKSLEAAEKKEDIGRTKKPKE